MLLASTVLASVLGACAAESEAALVPPTVAPAPSFVPPSFVVEAPAYFPLPVDVAANPMTPSGIALGRRLFYDPLLSRTHSVSCATCHEQSHAFTIPDALTTRGVSGKALVRHPPALFNLAWSDSGLFWDGGSKNLESLALAPIAHADEMGREHDLEGMLREFALVPEYPPLFEAAFGDRTITIGNLMNALAQFQRSIVSAGSRWDAWRRGGAMDWTADERLGHEVFERSCSRCHTPGLFTDGGYHNNGLDESFGDDAESPLRGRGRVTLNDADIGKYRTPSVRNAAQSGPFMHDGRLATLDDVIRHYRVGMADSSSLDEGFRRAGERPGVTMTDGEARALRAFLDLLTDPSLASDPRYSNPFVR